MKHIHAISKADTGVDLTTLFDRIKLLLQLITAAEPIIEIKKGDQSG